MQIKLGETPTSARAITAALLQDMYNFNRRPENWEIKQYAPATKAWGPGNGRARRLLWAVYTIWFLCMLRFDEVLNIKAKHLRFEPGGRVTITLPFRKTN